METKKCSGPCGRVLPLSHFTKDRTRKDGRKYHCRDCVKVIGDKTTTSSERKAYQEQYRKDNLSLLQEKDRQRYKNDPERAKQAAQDYRKNNVERVKLAAHTRYEANKEELLKKAKDWYCENREGILAQKKLDYQTEEHKEYIRTYNRSPKGSYSARKTIAKTRGIKFTLTFKQFMTFWQKPCIYGCNIATVGLDRVDSSRGYTMDNLQSMCEDHNKMKLDHSSEKFLQLCLQVVSSQK